MAKLKVRFIVNQGRHGAPMAKLGRIAEQTEKFLRALASDTGVDAKPGEWLAADFENSSVAYQAELPREVSLAEAEIFSKNLEFLADFDPDAEGLNGMVSDHTALEYSKIGSILDPDEIIRMGVVQPNAKKPKWRDITYANLSTMRRQIEQPIHAHGSIQGLVHSWFKEAREPYFQVRELSTSDLIKVFYANEMYDKVAKSVQNRATTIIVSGKMSYDRVSRQAVELFAERIEAMGSLSSAEFSSLAGSSPNFSSDVLESEK